MNYKQSALLTLLMAVAGTGFAKGKSLKQYPAQYDVVWTSPGVNENQSMPIGNGDLAANVWTEQNGDIVLLLAKADAWAETGNILKLGRVRLKMTPCPLPDSNGFTQTLMLENGTIEIKRGNNTIQVWADANQPVMHVTGNLSEKTKITASLELWRNKKNAALFTADTSFTTIMKGERQPKLKPDLIFPITGSRLAWCHYNADSYYPYLMRQEHLESLLPTYPDPLYKNCFGVLMTGPGLTRQDDTTLTTATAQNSFLLDMVALTDSQLPAPQDWLGKINRLQDKLEKKDINDLNKMHRQWWNEFWERSRIELSGSDDAVKVSQGYAVQRYMVSASSRGRYPVKFNGGLFTVGHDMTGSQDKANHDPDYRAWGDAYWNQNNRLMYWPLITTGDTDLLRPWFAMYLDRLDFQKARNQLYHHHEGASYPETMHFWGLPRLGDFGKNNPTNEIVSHWQRYHVQGSMEVIAQMLDLYDYYGNESFAQNALVPFADAIVTYYDKHWNRTAEGKIQMAPMQSLETYQLDAVNPTPDIAGLMSIIPRLLSLPAGTITAQQKTTWTKVLNDLPPLPMGKTAKKKTPPMGMGDPGGTTIILPAEKYGKPGNSENPELYVAFPYRLYGVGKPDLELARNTYAARKSPQYTCWGQDGTQASVLGLTDEAKKAVISEFTNYGDQRFSWFWKPAHDWIPDLDNGGSGMITLQNMLVQYNGKKIMLLPAWPNGWNADFKLHAPYNTTITGKIVNGKIKDLEVLPKGRKVDVVVMEGGKL